MQYQKDSSDVKFKMISEEEMKRQIKAELESENTCHRYLFLYHFLKVSGPLNRDFYHQKMTFFTQDVVEADHSEFLKELNLMIQHKNFEKLSKLMKDFNNIYD